MAFDMYEQSILVVSSMSKDIRLKHCLSRGSSSFTPKFNGDVNASSLLLHAHNIFVFQKDTECWNNFRQLLWRTWIDDVAGWDPSSDLSFSLILH